MGGRAKHRTCIPLASSCGSSSRGPRRSKTSRASSWGTRSWRREGGPSSHRRPRPNTCRCVRDAGTRLPSRGKTGDAADLLRVSAGTGSSRYFIVSIKTMMHMMRCVPTFSPFPGMHFRPNFDAIVEDLDSIRLKVTCPWTEAAFECRQNEDFEPQGTQNRSSVGSGHFR